MRRKGPLRIRLAAGEDLDPWLDQFFAQHDARWRGEGIVKFEDERLREFCTRLVHAGHASGLVRFTMLEWNEVPRAFDITLVRGDTHLCFLVSRDRSVTRYSPGRILQAHVIRAALQAGARRYEFGLGDERHKLSRASASSRVVGWAMWPT